MQKVFLYDLTLIHNTSITDKETDGWMRDSWQWYHRHSTA